MLKVVAVVPTYNRWSKTQRFLQRFSKQTYRNLTVVIVDAHSPDNTANKVKNQYSNAVVLSVDSSQYWAGATNAGVRYALSCNCDYVLTINDDAMIGYKHVEQLVDLAQRHNLPILGNRIDYLSSPGEIWALGTQMNWGTPHFLRLLHHGDRVDSLPVEITSREILAVDTLPGNGVLIHYGVFEQVGLYQSRYLPHYHADSELILRAGRKGFQAYVAPYVVLRDDFSDDQKEQNFKDIAGLSFAFLSPKSHLFVPAIAYIFLRYCPWYAYPQTLYYLLVRLLRLGKGRHRTEGNSR